MLKLRDMLLAHGFQVWMDVDQMSDRDNIFDSMAAAVEQASVVVVCICQEYVQSENCRLECQYVSSLLVGMHASHSLTQHCAGALAQQADGASAPEQDLYTSWLAWPDHVIHVCGWRCHA